MKNNLRVVSYLVIGIAVIIAIGIWANVSKKKNQESKNISEEYISQEDTVMLETKEAESENIGADTEENQSTEDESEINTEGNQEDENVENVQTADEVATVEQVVAADDQNELAEFSDTDAGSSTKDWAARLSVAQSTSQMVVVTANGSYAQVSMHQINAVGEWEEIMTTAGFVGSDGVGKASENESKTPAGVYTLTQAFGVNANPGTSLPYTQVNDSYYWVDDVNSPYYNRFVSTNDTDKNWDSAEHLVDYPSQYAYAIAIDYNTQCTPGAGSAIFFHCSNGGPTAGCVAIPQGDLIYVLNHIRSGCLIVIAEEDNIGSYER